MSMIDYRPIQDAIDREFLTPLLNYWLSHTFEEWMPYWGA